MKYKKGLVMIIPLLLAIILGFLGLRYLNKDSAPVDPNFSENIEPTPTMEVEDTKYPYTGIYENGEILIYLYQFDDEYVYFSISNSFYGRAMINSDKAEGMIIFDIPSANYVFSLNENDLNVETDSDKVPSGLYTRKGGLTISRFFELTFGGNSSNFNSKYNGLYQSGINTIYMYQLDEKHVKVIIFNDVNNLKLECEINENGELVGKIALNTYTIRLNNDGLTLSMDGKSSSDFSGDYIKNKTITMIDFLKNDVLFYY